MADRRRDSLLVQGGILAAAGIVTKLMGFLYRIPMANLLGEQGNGVYSVAFGIYSIALTLSSYALPSAVAKLISQRLGARRPADARRVFVMAALFSLVAGLCACGVLLFGADLLELAYRRPGLARPLRVLAPTTAVVAVLGVLRGWFQGRGNMVPTAVSQILEQLAHVVVGLVGAWRLLRLFGDSSAAASYGAAGGALGTLAGAVAALLFVLVLYARCARREKPLAAGAATEGRRRIARCLLATVVPLLLSQSIYQLGTTLDDLLFGWVMSQRGMEQSLSGALLGVYNTQYNQMTTLPVAITTAMAATLLPGLAMLLAQRQRARAMGKARAMIKLNMVIAIPAAVGLAVLARPILQLLYPRLTAYQHLSVRLLQMGAVSVIFYAFSTITAAVLQGSGHMGVPVKNAALSLAVHVALVYVLLRFTPLHIYGLLIGNVTFPMLLAVLNWRSLGRRLYFAWEYRRTFLLPLVASLPMAAVAAGLLLVLEKQLVLPLAMAVALPAAMAVYALALLRLGCFSPMELETLPLARLWLALARKE